MERVFLWRLEARVWSGQRDGWGCLFGVELAGGGGGASTRCVIGIHTKTDASGHGPASFPPDRLSSAQEWDTNTSSRLRHIIWACQGLYQAGSSGALGLSPHPPTGSGIPAHAFLRHIPVPGGVSPVEDQGWAEVQLLLCIVPIES